MCVKITDINKDKSCNCRQKNCCPPDRKCLTKCVVCKATVTKTNSNTQETYIQLTENELKTRFNLHKSSFKLEHKRTTTTLSDHIWELKKKQSRFQHQMGDCQESEAKCEKVCKLCLQEKFPILTSELSLNQRTEIFGHCVH